MKKSLILISIIALFISLTSCKKNEEKDYEEINKGNIVNEVIVQFNNQSVQLNNKMNGKELYLTLFQKLCGEDNVSLLFKQYENNMIRPHQICREISNIDKYKNSIDADDSGSTILVSGEKTLEQTITYNTYISESKKVFCEKTMDGFQNENGTKENDKLYEMIYGEETEISLEDEDYVFENGLPRQYKDTLYYYNKSDESFSSLENGIYEQKYTTTNDLKTNNYNMSTSKYRAECQSFFDECKPEIITKFWGTDDWIDDYIQYNYELTDQYIILTYHTLFDLSHLYELAENGTLTMETIKNDSQNGNYYEVIAYINYKSEGFANQGYLLCDYLKCNRCIAMSSKGTYDERYNGILAVGARVPGSFAGIEYDFFSKKETKYTWKCLNISNDEIEKKKMDLINLLK